MSRSSWVGLTLHAVGDFAAGPGHAVPRITRDVRGTLLVAALTTQSVLELHLDPGLAVVATFNAMAVHRW
jgi:ABC-type molybdate transport system ATPase subunit